jgi:hypothetical protein
VKLAGSIMAIAANIALMPDAKGTAFRTVGGREAAIRVLTAAAQKLAEIERANEAKVIEPGWDPS